MMNIILKPDHYSLTFQIIRPWKSRLALILLTVVAIFSRPLALQGLQKVLKRLGADDRLLAVARREEPLKPYPPPGSDRIVLRRKGN